jgi:hypothetical protein
MSQFNIKVIPDVDDGTSLAEQINTWRDALHTSHSGATRPGYAVPGTIWIDISSPGDWIVYVFDGSIDIPISRFSGMPAYQPLDGDLTAIAAIPQNTGLLRKTSANTWVLDTAAYMTPATGVASFKTRVGAVVPINGDYEASMVTLDPANIEGVQSTNVQGGMEELGTLFLTAKGGLIFVGTLSYNDPDPPVPLVDGPSHYYIFRDQGTRTVGDAAGAEILLGDWLVYHRAPGVWRHLRYSQRSILASAVGYDPTGNTFINATNVDTALDQVDAALVVADTRLDALEFYDPTGNVYITATDLDTAMDQVDAVLVATDARLDAIEAKPGGRVPFYNTNGVLVPITLVP